MLPVISSGRIRDRVPALRSLLISTSALTAVALLATGPGRAQTAPPPAQVAQNQVTQNPGQLPPVQIEAPRKKPQARAKKPGGQLSTTPAPPSPGVGPSASQALAGIPMTPLNGVAASATRLGLPVIETPASVDIVTRQTMQEQGYRTTTDTALGAVGVLAGDAGRRAGRLFDAGLQLQRGERHLQWNLDRPPGHHVALDGHGQSRAGRVPQRSVVLDVGTECDRRGGQLCQPAADVGADPE